MGQSGQPDFVIGPDGQLVPTRDIQSADLRTPEAHIPGTRPASKVEPQPPAPPARRGPPPPPAATGATHPPVRRAPPTPAGRAPASTGPGAATRPPPAATPRASGPQPQPPVLRGTPDRRTAPLGPPTADVDWDGRSEEIEFDDRSLAEVAFEVTGSFEALEVPKLAPPVARNRPSPARPTPEATRRPPRGISPSETVVRGVGQREGESEARFQPRVAPRPIKERGRHRAGGQTATSGGSLQQKADWLYQEALKEIAVGNLDGARRHLKLAVSFAPQDARIQSALQNLGR
ncbi:MAG: hypothetical protein AAGD10_13620 [Myxococcota bacterium]